MRKKKHEVQLEVTKAIISGELLLEEAMLKYGIKDKRTIQSWLRKVVNCPSSDSRSKNKPSQLVSNEVKRSLPTFISKSAKSYDEIYAENILLKKVLSLEDRVKELEEMNRLLVKQRDVLLE